MTATGPPREARRRSSRHCRVIALVRARARVRKVELNEHRTRAFCCEWFASRVSTRRASLYLATTAALIMDEPSQDTRARRFLHPSLHRYVAALLACVLAVALAACG